MRGFLAEASWVEQVHMAQLRIWSQRPRVEPLVLEAAGLRIQLGLVAHVSPVHVSTAVIPGGQRGRAGWASSRCKALDG